jgi:DEAD/DEAH box helicase domain-containing protein
MCDPRDLGATLGATPDEDAPEGESGGLPALPRKERGGAVAGYHPTLFLYEHVPGGTGLAERIWEQRDVLLERTRRMIERCPCSTGCPSCVGPGNPTRKDAAIELLGLLGARTFSALTVRSATGQGADGPVHEHGDAGSGP